MFSLNNIVLPGALEGKLGFLTDFGIYFGGFVANIKGGSLPVWIPVWIFFGFITVLIFNNSIQKLQVFKLNLKNIIVFSVLSYITATHFIYQLGESSEFLYFNF